MQTDYALCCVRLCEVLNLQHQAVFTQNVVCAYLLVSFTQMLQHIMQRVVCVNEAYAAKRSSLTVTVGLLFLTRLLCLLHGVQTCWRSLA